MLASASSQLRLTPASHHVSVFDRFEGARSIEDRLMIRGYFLAFGEDVAATQVALVDGRPRGSCRSPPACRCADRARSASRTWWTGASGHDCGLLGLDLAYFSLLLLSSRSSLEVEAAPELDGSFDLLTLALLARLLLSLLPVALLLRVALLEVGLAGVLLLELVTDCALPPLLLRLTGSEHGLVTLLGVVLDRDDLFQVDRLGRELHSEELGLLSDDAPHPAVMERQAVAPLVLLARRP